MSARKRSQRRTNGPQLATVRVVNPAGHGMVSLPPRPLTTSSPWSPGCAPKISELARRLARGEHS